MSEQQINEMISQLQQLKKMKAQGAGFMDVVNFAKNIFDKGKQIYQWAKKEKPISKVLDSTVYKVGKQIASSINPALTETIDKGINFVRDKTGFGDDVLMAQGGMKNIKQGKGKRGRPKKVK